ncbi:MAG: NAD(P)-dependent oxidoreductase [Novosphingobium sp.]
MAGYAVHEVLHVERDFGAYQGHKADAQWAPLPLRPPHHRTVAVLGHGSMGAAVTQALAALGFTVTAACRRPPREPVKGVTYFTGDDAVMRAATGADTLVNVLPLTSQTHDILNKDLFGRLVQGAWLVQIGRGEHLHVEDFIDALDSGQLSGASLDVFVQEPLPTEHAFWQDPRLRITPHIASDATPHVVSEQAVQSARELLAGRPLSLAVDREQGY